MANRARILSFTDDEVKEEEEEVTTPPVSEASEPDPEATPTAEAQGAAEEPEAPKPEAVSEPVPVDEPNPGNPGPEAAEAIAEVQEALADVEKKAEEATKVSIQPVDIQQAVRVVAEAVAELSRIVETEVVSNADGKRWIPKENESKEAFIKRASGDESSFNIGVWEQAHGADVRKEFPGNFGGEGW